jgi:phenylalanyl-tRNA synthetase alpha chain
MKDQINKLFEEIKLFKATSLEELEQFRIKFLGRKGHVQELFSQFKEISPELKRELGKPLNELKNSVSEKIESLKAELKKSESKGKYDGIDITLDAAPIKFGSRHPISIVQNKIIEIFSRLGFTLSEGPEIVDDWHNFTALNFPPDHPARDMQDTFFVQKNPDFVLRTHTSPVQIQEMLKQDIPFRTISLGRVYRNETLSYKSLVQFHQIEGLFIDPDVSFSDLKQTLFYFVKEFFGEEFEIRFRPSYFPFTEPSAEMDIRRKGNSEWLEILGCGMVDPNVLENCKIDSEKYSGYAFGIGIERMTKLLYGVEDIRSLYENDIRFLEQFSFEG